MTLSPAPSAEIRKVLEGVLWRPGTISGQGPTVRQAIPNGRYDVYLYFVENYRSNFRRMDIRLEGTIVGQQVGSLPVGSWTKLGPYRAEVRDNRLDLDILNGGQGDPAVMGVSIFRVP